jgi:hypothetical protein
MSVAHDVKQMVLLDDVETAGLCKPLDGQAVVESKSRGKLGHEASKIRTPEGGQDVSMPVDGLIVNTHPQSDAAQQPDNSISTSAAKSGP